jgi:peptidoglycan hydrolase-like protein with peptidoglycan-binding domain
MIAFYRPNGANFYTISGGDINREKIEIIISTESNALLDTETEALYDSDDVVVVTAPENTGLALIRVPLAGLSYAGRAEQALRQARCDRVIPQGSPAENRVAMITSVQRELQERDYEPGAADGIESLQTQAAIMAYQSDAGLAITGVASDDLLRHMVLGEDASSMSRRPGISPEGKELISAVQRFLRGQGYRPGPADGVPGRATRRAISAFERDRDLPPTGRVSGKLVREIVAIGGANFADAVGN